MVYLLNGNYKLIFYLKIANFNNLIINRILNESTNILQFISYCSSQSKTDYFFISKNS